MPLAIQDNTVRQERHRERLQEFHVSVLRNEHLQQQGVGDQAIPRMLKASPDTHAEREAPSGDPLGGVD